MNHHLTGSLLRPLLIGRDDAQDDEDRLRQIAADGLARMHFRADNTRAHGLNVERLDIEL
ncbi:hypothetical protein ACFVG1_35200 [Streptomyces bacillaris]|uniref:hypothetical protein n=1 Tax=Streptomyces TaxID=1883 RepID=UPI001ED9F2FE|nr:hypothetical protein [Streptomyces sp. NBU3104]UKL07436.1 hypothetical protein L2I08_30810 [Streptomyces sp. NBU3104]